MAQKSMVDIAYEYAKQFDDLVPFKTLWEKVVEELGFSEEEAKAKISIFYTNLSLDCRFHCESDNTWILRSKLLFDDATKNVFFIEEDGNEGESEEGEEYGYSEDDGEESDDTVSSEIEDDDDDSLNSNMYNNDDDDDDDVI
ncbi:MAG: DNA-directed RNA polymerase subunit delta [Erysipelotrichales bacterium]|nr:DNA-directed RNA polymerase subunit delta [Erysipelotrichales bacterium]